MKTRRYGGFSASGMKSVQAISAVEQRHTEITRIFIKENSKSALLQIRAPSRKENNMKKTR